MAYDKFLEWTPEEEIKLLLSHEGLKPVGINKHFYMAFIANKFSKSINRNVATDEIWAHLRTLYNLDLLDKEEPLPFPNEEREFTLPENEFSSFLQKKLAESDNESSSGASGIFDKSFGGVRAYHLKDLDRKVAAKLSDLPKRAQKRTRGSLSLEMSPSTTPPPNNKRRRI